MKNRFFSRVSNALSSYFSSFGKGLFITALLLSVVGILAVNTATAVSATHRRYVLTQILAVAIGIAVVFILSKVRYDFLGQFSLPIILVSFVLLMFTALFGSYIGGNTNWIRIGSFMMQPSEFTKAAFVLTFSTHVANVKDSVNKIKTLALLILHFAAYFVPILLQGDYGSALIYIAAFLVILFLAGLHYRYLVIGGVLAVASAPILWNFVLKDYHKKRILFSLNPELDPQHFGYQPLISRIAIGSGELTGMGYGQGVQSQNQLLPAGRTDFIFSVIGEETGFIGNMVVFGLLILLVVMFARARRRAKDDAGALICCGFAAMFAFQSLINIGMCIGISPVIGVTLPFVSAGGSSVIASFLAVGMTESVLLKPDLSLRFGSARRK